MKLKNSLKLILGGFFAAALFTACDQYDEDIPPTSSKQLIVHNDYFVTQKNRPILLNVFSNDTITGNASLQFSNPAYGTLQTGTGGQIFYQPKSNFTGRDSLTYTACLGPNCATAKITIRVVADTVGGCNLRAVNDSVFVTQNQVSVVEILNNDTNCYAKPAISYLPNHGHATINNAYQLQYTPAGNYIGSDYLEYDLTYQGQRVRAAVHLQVLPDQVTGISKTTSE